jgi:hypothetical protein
MARIDSELLRRLESLGPDGACEVIIVPSKAKNGPGSQPGHGKSAVDRILDFLVKSSTKFSYLKGIGVITASLSPRDVLELGRNDSIDLITGNFSFKLVK